MSSYLTRNFKISNSHLAEQHQILLQRSAEAAGTFVRLITNMDPVTKDERVRYLADFGFVMLSFCCQFIIRACEAFGPTVPKIMEHLTTVKDAVQLMKEIAIDSSHSPAIYSALIGTGLEKLKAITIPTGRVIDEQNTDIDNPLNEWVDGLMSMDPLWDFDTYIQDSTFIQGV
jgi:hypothetical protein